MNDQSFTFGVITDGRNPERLKKVIDSILPEADLYDDIIVIGGKEKPKMGVTWVPFDESIKNSWITKKKNLIAELARTEYLCLMHDYVALQKGWRDGYKEFTDLNGPWLSCTNVILNMDGKRFRDWAAIYNDAWMEPPIDDQKPPHNTVGGHLLHYNNQSMGRWQYYSGAYFCAMRHLMLGIPLDESRVWGTGEDVQWSRKIYKAYDQRAFNFNPFSRVQFLKQKERAPWESLSPI